MHGAWVPSQIGEPRFHTLHSTAKKKKKNIRKKTVPFLEPCESSCLKPWVQVWTWALFPGPLGGFFWTPPAKVLSWPLFLPLWSTHSFLSLFPNLRFLPQPSWFCLQGSVSTRGGRWYLPYAWKCPSSDFPGNTAGSGNSMSGYLPKLRSWVVARLRAG